MNNKKELIDVLLDPTSRDDEKDDAAMDLSEITDDEEVICTLFQVANNSSYDDMIKASCGESIASIWLQRNKIDLPMLGKLQGIAFSEALSVIKSKRFDWYKQFVEKYPDKLFNT